MQFGGPTKLHRKSGSGLHQLRNSFAGLRQLCEEGGEFSEHVIEDVLGYTLEFAGIARG